MRGADLREWVIEKLRRVLEDIYALMKAVDGEVLEALRRSYSELFKAYRKLYRKCRKRERSLEAR